MYVDKWKCSYIEQLYKSEENKLVVVIKLLTHLGFKTIVLKIILVISLIRGWPELESSRVDVEASISGGETSWDELIILWHAVAAEKKTT